MQPQSQTDHVALLALMLAGILIERLSETGNLDAATARRIHHLVGAVRIHAKNAGLNDLEFLFDNLDRALRTKTEAAETGEPDACRPVVQP
jgi:hypothetical protein